MNKKAFGVFCIALASLLLELALIRVFDVLWYPNMAYLIITLAVFSFGLAGVYLSIGGLHAANIPRNQQVTI
jgi:multisubunit Na+/H+ antiporter MnhC subunit